MNLFTVNPLFDPKDDRLNYYEIRVTRPEITDCNFFNEMPWKQ